MICTEVRFIFYSDEISIPTAEETLERLKDAARHFLQLLRDVDLPPQARSDCLHGPWQTPRGFDSSAISIS